MLNNKYNNILDYYTLIINLKFKILKSILLKQLIRQYNY